VASAARLRVLVSPGTAGRHIFNLYAKIGAQNRADATAYAFRHQLA
jgi:DNA-binding NarL/FixJ family response regulator